MLRVTTESGRVYEIDREEGFWRRLPKSDAEYPMGWERIWQLKSGDVLAWPWNDDTDSFVDVPEPVIGKYMFISAKNVWWTSTEVVSIEHVPSPFSTEEEEEEDS